MKSKGYVLKADPGLLSSRAGSNPHRKESAMGSALGSAPDTERQRFEEQFAELTRHRRECDQAEHDHTTKTEAILKKLEEKNDGKVIHSAFYN